jgi:hypothetical protein
MKINLLNRKPKVDQKPNWFLWFLHSRFLLPVAVCGLSVLMVGLPGNPQILAQMAEFRLNENNSISYRDIAAEEKKQHEIDWKEIEEAGADDESERDIAAQVQSKDLKNMYDTFHKRQTSLFERIQMKNRQKTLEQGLSRDLESEYQEEL